MASVNPGPQKGEMGHRQRRSKLPDRVGGAFVRLGGIGRIGTVGVPSLPFAAVWAAALIVIAAAASPHLLSAHSGRAFQVRAIVVGRAVGVPAWPEAAVSTFAWLVAMLWAELRLG